MELKLKNVCILFFNNSIYLIYEYIAKYHRILFQRKILQNNLYEIGIKKYVEIIF